MAIARPVSILAAVLTDGLPAVEAACAQAMAEGVDVAGAIITILRLPPRSGTRRADLYPGGGEALPCASRRLRKI